ncbi:MAG: hypothetical protein P1Q69_03600 [Candidatus Thorarchaeota archaeon]|nr:hypothetical protein [Candidatus Thorarchaeota archaeon]
MEYKIHLLVAVLTSVLLATGVLVVATQTGDVTDDTYSLLPGMPTEESPFADFVNSTDGSIQYPPNHETLSLKPFITRIDYTNQTLIDQAQALRTAWKFLESVLSFHDYESISYSSSEHFGILPRWSFEFLNATQEPPKSVVAYVGVSSVTGNIVSYTGPLPASVDEYMTDFNETEIARGIVDTFNTSIPSNSQYIQSNDSNERFFFSFSQIVGPVLIHSSIGSIQLEIDTRFGGRCYYGVDWVPFSEIPTEGIIIPNSEGYEIRSLILIPTPYVTSDGLSAHDFRLCWWLYEPSYQSPVVDGDMIIDAFSGEIIQIINYNQNPRTSSLQAIALVIPFSGIIFASITYVIAKRKFTIKLTK